MKNILLGTFCFLAMLRCTAQRDMAEAASVFIKTLSKEQQNTTVFPFDTEERYNFNFVPKDDRKGISLNDLDAAQKQAALALLKTALSNQGYEKTNEIMRLEVVLKAIENRKSDDHYRDPGKYFFTIFGIPANNTIWGWRLEGHHVSFNFSSNNGKLVAGTPGFLGSNPAIVKEGPQKGKQILKDETEVAFDLLHSLSGDQLKKGVINSTAFNEIVTSNNRKAMIEHPSGLAYSEMSSAQQEHLLRLVGIYVHRYTKLFADTMLKEIQKAGLGALRFAWAGSQQPGAAHYYRIQGPTLLIEYDNSQNNANHVHTVVRDLQHDFGGDALLEHYKQSH